MEKFAIDLKTVGHRIKMARKQLRLTQEAVAERAELTGQYWSLIENGRYRGSVITYFQIATVLGLTLNDLFYDDTDIICRQQLPRYKELLIDLSEYEKAVLTKSIAMIKAALIQARDLL